jgi:hypothetical protein
MLLLLKRLFREPVVGSACDPEKRPALPHDPARCLIGISADLAPLMLYLAQLHGNPALPARPCMRDASQWPLMQFAIYVAIISPHGCHMIATFGRQH